MTTTTKRGPGRPATKKATATEPVKAKTKIKRQLNENAVREYKTIKSMGATYMMQQKGTTVFDAEENRIREIRYCPNEPSIYREEQSDNARRESVVFIEGRKFVRPDQPNLIEFMETHPDNKANGGNLFEVVNKEKKAEVEVEKEFLVADAVMMIRNKDLEELLGVAVAESFDNPVVEMKTKLKMAEKYQIIKLDSDGVKWYDTNKLIVSVPAGKDPLDVFVRYCLTEVATPIVEEIDKQMNA